MSTTKDFKEYILEQLSNLNITCRPMMGEFLLYCDGLLFGGLYDGRLLIKDTASNSEFEMKKVIPYEGAKREMLFVEDVDDVKKLEKVVTNACRDLLKGTL